MVTRAIAKLEAPGAGKQAIVDQFYNLIDRAVADDARKGCLLTNTAVELGAHDQETANGVAVNIQRVEKAFKKVLTTAVEIGEINQEHDVTALAKFLTCCLQGLRVISKVNPDREALQDMAKIALSVLD